MRIQVSGIVRACGVSFDTHVIPRPFEYADMKKFIIYWSSLEKYEECPRKFLWYRGWGTIDLGRGFGRGKAIPVQRSEHHAVMGTVIQRVVEDLYNEQLWAQYRGAELRKVLDDLTLKYFDEKIDKAYIEWGTSFGEAGTRSELLEICLNGVRGFVKTMKHNQLLGVYNRAEEEFIVDVDENTTIGGRADLVIRREPDREQNPGTMILDGKNSLSKGKYTDPDQIRWYALCMFLKHGVFPDRLGFVYYRYPYGTPLPDKEGEVETGVDWVPFTKDDLDGIAERARQALINMKAEKFDPTPSPKVCKYCDFESECEERQAQKSENKAKRKPKSGPKKETLDILDAFQNGKFEL